MNEMQKMLMQAQKMQRELMKAHQALAEKEFIVEKAGMVKLTMLGDKTVKGIEIDADALDAENKDMLEETIAMAVNEAIGKINAETEEVESRITGQKGGLPF